MTNFEVENDIDIETQIAQTERIGLGDMIIAALLAVTAYVLATLWQFPSLVPSAIPTATVAAGVRPAANLLPGLSTLAADLVYRVCGLSGGSKMLILLGHAALAVIAIIVYAALREMLAFIMRARPQSSRRRSLVMQLAAVVGTVAFVACEPVWTMGQTLTGDTVKLVLTLCAIETFFVFLRKGALVWSYLAAFFLGLLCAETPMGFVFLALFIIINHVVLNVLPVLESPFFKPEVIAVGKWLMTFIFLGSLVLGVGLNVLTFVLHNGLGANGIGSGQLPLEYLLGYWKLLSSASGFAGWIMLLGVCLIPFIVTIIRFPIAADEEMFLSYGTGIVFLFSGAVAFSQCCALPSLWFWCYFPVGSDYLLSIGLMLSAITLAGAITILGVDALCRNHKRLALQLFGQDEVAEAEEHLASRRSANFIRRAGLVIIPSALVAAILPGRVKSEAREMLGIFRDAVEEIVTEAAGCTYLFTGGHFDDAIELESARRGGTLYCLALTDGNSARERMLRTRGMWKDPEDSFSFNYDCGMGLRGWIRDKPAKLKNAAVMMGFDLWKRDGKPLPPMGGILSLPDGWKNEAERLRGLAAANALTERILEVYKKRRGHKVTEREIEDKFLAVQWRLARMCLVRGERADLAGEAEIAIAEAKRATALNENNRVHKKLLEAITRQNELMLRRLTPREGLQLALVRADFTMAKLYAETILVADPENHDANFGMGMFYLGEKQYTRAEEYLRRCLISKPYNPTVYNNLAMLQIEIGKFAAAEVNVKKALKLLPDSAAVKDTLKKLEAAKKKAAGKQ